MKGCDARNTGGDAHNTEEKQVLFSIVPSALGMMSLKASFLRL